MDLWTYYSEKVTKKYRQEKFKGFRFIPKSLKLF